MPISKYIAVILLSVSLSCFSQNKDFKYGKVNVKDLQLEECTFKPDASSMILGESGNLKFIYNSEKGWQYRLDVVVRKKIFDASAKDEGNIRLKVYDPVNSTDREEIRELKATTYNLESGKVVKTKLSNSDIFETRLSDFRIEKSFAMPKVQNGSIIEYKYSIVSDYIYNLRTWFFQGDIPVKYSFFQYTIPEFFTYQTSQVGNVMENSTSEDKIRETFTYTWRSDVPGALGKTQKETGSMESYSTRTTMIVENSMPVEDEPMMNNEPDLPFRVEFQLETVQMPNQPIQNHATSYQKFNTKILDWSTFGGVIDKGSFAKDFIATLAAKSEMEKASSIYYWLSQNTSWNDVNTFTTSLSPKQLMQEKTGNIAALNLSLVAALREANIKANPIILSTRGHGTVHPVYPNVDHFNYVIAGAFIEDKLYLLDVSGKLPFGMLPVRCLNGKGWMVASEGGQWITLKNGTYETQVTSEVSVDEEQIINHFYIKKTNYASVGTYNKLKKMGNEEYAKELAEYFDESILENFIASDSNNVIHTEMTFDLIKETDEEDILYINPMQYGPVTENPFKREQRKSPIDFSYTLNNQTLVTIKVPEGYSAELPQPTIVKLPNNGGSFLYSATQLADTITILSRMSLKKDFFSVEEYAALKQFYQLMADKNNEFVILTKS